MVNKTFGEAVIVLIIFGAVAYSVYNITVTPLTPPAPSPPPPPPPTPSPTGAPLATYLQTWKYPFNGSLGGIAEDPQSGHVMDAHKFFVLDSENGIAEFIPDYNLFKRWSIPTPNSGAFFGISAMNLQSVFFTESKANKIGMLDEPNNIFTEWNVPNASNGKSQPYDIVVESVSGPVYFTDKSGDRIGQLSIGDNEMKLWSLPTGRKPSGVTLSEGNVYFLEDNNRIARLIPGTNMMTEWTAPPTFSSWSDYITTSQGFLFVTTEEGNRIGMFNPSTSIFTEWTVPTENGGPKDIIVDSTDPSLRAYFVESKHGRIGLLDTLSGGINITLSSTTKALDAISTQVSWNSTIPIYDEIKISPSTFMITGFMNNSFVEWPLHVPDVGLEALAPSALRLLFTHNSGIVGRFQTIVNTVTEYELPSDCYPQGLSVYLVESGNVFFTEKDNKVAYLNYLQSSLVEWTLPSPDARPFSLAPWYSGDTGGSIFFTEEGANKIASLNPSTNILKEWSIPTPESKPRGIAFLNNILYFTEFGGNKIGALNLNTNTFTEWSIPTAFSGTTSLELWLNGIAFTETHTNKIGYLDPQNNRFEEYTVPTSDSFPTELMASESGHLYFAENGSSQIGRLKKDGLTAVVEEWSIPVTNQSVSGYITSIVRQGRNIFFLDAATNEIGFHDPALDTPISTNVVEPTVSRVNSTSITVTPVETLLTQQVRDVASGWITVIGEVSFTRTPIEQMPDGFVKWAIPTTESKPLKILTTDGYGVFFTESKTNKIGRLSGSWF
jgi:virginiamycin B lyase